MHGVARVKSVKRTDLVSFDRWMYPFVILAFRFSFNQTMVSLFVVSLTIPDRGACNLLHFTRVIYLT